jgi:NAD(P)-dependent dehydrogenase (short-subunit alcohol dehydrogenase family)
MAPIRILVTGGNRGIGRAIALRFAREGAQICILARDSDALDKVVGEIEAAGGSAIAAQANLRDHGSIEAGVYRAVDFFEGEMDVLVNNAGIFDVKSFEDTDLTLWSRMIEVNLTGPFVVLQEALPALKESPKGHIFNVSSTAGKQGYAGSTAYCASKYGLRGFSDALREELRDDKVRVSTVYPDLTDTEIFNGVDGDWDRSTMNKPEDVAEIIWNAYAAEGDQADIDVPPPA